MAGATRVLGIVAMVAATSCAAILGDDFTISNDEDDGDSDGSTSGECTDAACNACGPDQCPDEFQYCVDIGCTQYFDCYDGITTCDIGPCEDCWPDQYNAALAAATCLCAECQGECCGC